MALAKNYFPTGNDVDFVFFIWPMAIKRLICLSKPTLIFVVVLTARYFVFKETFATIYFDIRIYCGRIISISNSLNQWFSLRNKRNSIQKTGEALYTFTIHSRKSQQYSPDCNTRFVPHFFTFDIWMKIKLLCDED